jgi:UPF0755 protein
MRREWRALILPRVGKFLKASAAVIILLALILFIGWLATKELFKPPLKSRRVVVEIKPGSTASEIGLLLEKKGVIKNALFFRLYARYKGLGAALKPGRYVLKQNMSYEEIFNRLVKGPPEKYYKITIPEGYMIDQIAKRLTEFGFDGERFRLLAYTRKSYFEADFPFLAQNPNPSLEGYLFPKTYKVKKGTTPENFIRLLLKQFQKETEFISASTLAAKQLNLHQVITIASLVEKEAKLPEERPLIAAVIFNRLRKGMPLQVDATVQYALPEWKDRLTYEDLKVKSLYNTYLNKGLPPGPICNPGLDSIKATLNPAKVNYLYYVVIDESGRHAFSNTLAEHNRAKAKARVGR